MRIEGGARAPGAGVREGDGARFREALAARSAQGRGSARPAARRAPSGPGLARPAAGAEPGRGESPGAAPRPGGERPAPPVELQPASEVARLARAVVPALAVAGSAAGAPLALSFGRSLDVELRATPAGVEVVLRPAQALARAADAELPRLVAALRVRGVTVTSAAVRPRGRAAAGSTRVDAERGVR